MVANMVADRLIDKKEIAIQPGDLDRVRSAELCIVRLAY